MDGEVAQMAALAISANYRLTHPDAPMPWFDRQRAFASCGEIGFCAPRTGASGRTRDVRVAETPAHWLRLLSERRVKKVQISCTRQDTLEQEDDVLPDRLAAGFAGGGSLWTMATISPEHGTLCWQAGWRVAFPAAEDGRIWKAEYYGAPCEPAPPGAPVEAATQALSAILHKARDFAAQHGFEAITTQFASALALLSGEVDPLGLSRPPGPTDVMHPAARRLIFAAQRAWIFDNLELWRDQDFSQEAWHSYADISEALYGAVTAAIVAAVNADMG